VAEAIEFWVVTMTESSHVPIRTCIGCRERATRSELLRVVIGSDASGQSVVSPDPRGTAPGRGAHLHPTTGCYDLAVRRRAFSRALRAGEALSSTPVAEHLTAQQHLAQH
jgi:predicted RNA-binding protein YlxR (DUF448 family)